MADTQAPMETDAAPVKDASLTEVMVNTRNAMESAMATIALLRSEKERVTLTYQSVVAALRVENANLRRGENISDMEVSTANDDDSVKAAEIRAKVEAEMVEKMSATNLTLEKTKLRVAEMETALTGAKRKAADDAMVIQRLQTQVNELLTMRVNTEATIAENEKTAIELARDAAMNAAEKATVAKRSKFLENERTRLSAELVEVRSKLQVAAAEREAALKSSADSMRTLREELMKERQRGDQFAKEITLCRDEIVALQKARDKERGDALIESKHLNELIALHKEEVKDAEKEAKRYKDLLSTVAVDKLEGYGRPDMKTLDAHAEVLLKELQKSLEMKLDQIEAQRRLVDEAQDNERQMLLSFEHQARECEEAKRMNQSLMAEKSVLETENTELRRKVNRLEERILMAGGFMPNTPETPGRRFGTTPTSLRRTSVTPAKSKDDDTMDIVLQDLMDIRQKNENIMNTLAEHARRRSSSLGTPSNL